LLTLLAHRERQGRSWAKADARGAAIIVSVTLLVLCVICVTLKNNPAGYGDFVRAAPQIPPYYTPFPSRRPGPLRWSHHPVNARTRMPTPPETHRLLAHTRSTEPFWQGLVKSANTQAVAQKTNTAQTKAQTLNDVVSALRKKLDHSQVVV
jgi:hypothetical protein